MMTIRKGMNLDRVLTAIDNNKWFLNETYSSKDKDGEPIIVVKYMTTTFRMLCVILKNNAVVDKFRVSAFYG